jgi:hypothetical protein
MEGCVVNSNTMRMEGRACHGLLNGVEGYRACMTCPNFIIGQVYEGVAAAGSPFPVLTWQDCCAACQLFGANCAAWVHYTPGNGPMQCYLRTAVVRLIPSQGPRYITGVMPRWTPPPALPSPPPPPPSPPPPPPVQRYMQGNL